MCAGVVGGSDNGEGAVDDGAIRQGGRRRGCDGGRERDRQVVEVEVLPLLHEGLRVAGPAAAVFTTAVSVIHRKWTRISPSCMREPCPGRWIDNAHVYLKRAHTGVRVMCVRRWQCRVLLLCSRTELESSQKPAIDGRRALHFC